MAKKLNEIHGQPGLLRELEHSFQAGSVVHSFLIHGDVGCGKKTLATTLSMMLHCEAEKKEPCMLCGACVRMMAGTHPDHLVIRSDKGNIRVSEVRELLEKLNEKPYEGGWRTVIIEDADKMNDAAQNAFLKTLEEPDAQTVFFLLSSHPEALLATIRSRCRSAYMPRLDEETILQELLKRGFAEEKARYASRLCQGVLGRALDLCGQDPYYTYRDEALKMLMTLKSKEDVPKILSQMDEKRKAEDSVPFLDALETILRDIWRKQTGLPAFDARIEDSLDELATHFTIDAVACIMEEMVLVRRRVNAHVQWRSAVEPLLLRIVEA